MQSCLLFSDALYKLPEAANIRHLILHISMYSISSDMPPGHPVNNSTALFLFHCPRSHPICFLPASHAASQPTETRHITCAGQLCTNWQCAQQLGNFKHKLGDKNDVMMSLLGFFVVSASYKLLGGPKRRHFDLQLVTSYMLIKFGCVRYSVAIRTPHNDTIYERDGVDSI